MLSSEHRAAAASPPVHLELVADNAQITHLAVVAELHNENRSNLQQQVLALLAQGKACTRTKLRNSLSVKNERLGDALQSLQQAGRIERNSTGWQRIE